VHTDETGIAHVDDEQLAAFVDGALGPEERARVERHLAACDPCRRLFAEAVRTVAALEAADGLAAEGPRRTSPASPWRRRWLYAGGGLAAAAAIVLAVWWPGSRTREFDAAIAAFERAGGGERATAARTSVGQDWKPLRVMRSGSSPERRPEVTIAAGRVQQLARQIGSAESEARASAVLLAIGQVDEAIERMEDAARTQPDAARLADLSAAYFERHARDRSAADLDRARRYALQATSRDPRLARGWFNLALIEHARGATREAQTALDRYLALDPDSQWADELRARLGSEAP
jgi:tetratricopeptide (TPR) repeat protein